MPPAAPPDRARRLSPLPILLARVRMPLMWAGTAALAFGGFAGLSWWVRGPLFALGLLVYLRLGRVRCEPRTVLPPVRGRWMALTGPADAVPSQGAHAYGQTYALALAAEPADGSRPDVAWRPLSRPPEEFPAFGEPVHAPLAGTVVTVHQRARDHRSRTSWPWLVAMVAETALRELRGPAGLLGNHVVIEADGGGYLLLGHLRRGSVAVAPGERVAAGQHVADCGSSGSCAEPQLRLQLMDHRRPLVAAGLPLRFAPGSFTGPHRDGVPRAWRPFTA
ncbi:peptidoglycan DD-metalloendopeptidase family protein [Streptomonospora nanhaiensis]|uniref:Biotin carboxyl carrier protein n=1 Tax=Streptomonospora nanhaiensis TaxID=1323731 RepID=A0A853BTK8_9ACTN|nr:peptidoglycan DD-metalloendopeptidase family protein [Streptomonospora nanhaiensis]NYI98473.1 biotin carboxyl carrier protein [Streptomonospora nanhaiensis]